MRMVTGLSTGNDDDGIEVIGGVDPRIMALHDAAATMTTPRNVP